MQRSGDAHSLPHIEHGLPMPSSFASPGGQPGGGSMPTSTSPASRVPQAGFWPDEQPAAETTTSNDITGIALRSMATDYRFRPIS